MSVVPASDPACSSSTETPVIATVIDARPRDLGGVAVRKERLEQAKQDWRAGRFAKVAGDELERIPLPEM